MIYLITGGARSGKSNFAEKIALNKGGQDVYYLATSEVKDKEMAKRVEKHREHRPQVWETIEETLEVGKAISRLPRGSVIMIDCITILKKKK